MKKAQMRIRDVMIPCPYQVGGGMSLDEALKVMSLRGVRHLPVVDDGALLGVVSERDLRLAQLASAEIATPSVGALCRKDPPIVSGDTPLSEVALRMSEERLDCVLICTDDAELEGIFTSTDACRMLYMVLEEG